MKLRSVLSSTAALAKSYVAYRLSTGGHHSHLLSSEELDRLEWGRFSSGPLPPGSEAGGKETSSGAISISTWNIQYGRKLDRTLKALGEEVVSDIYLIQESDKACRRSRYRNVAGTLAAQLSLNYVFGIEFQEFAQQNNRQPALHGNAILSRFPFIRAWVLRFKHQPQDWSNEYFQPRRGGRMALAAEIQVGERRLMVYNTHLESRGSEEGRTRQLCEILQEIRNGGEGLPVVIGGDLNTREGISSPVVRRAFQEGFRDMLGQSDGNRATSGTICRDWILARGMAAISAMTHVGNRASDHRPVSALLAWQK